MAMAARVPLVALACLLSLFPHTVAEAEQSQDEALCAVRRSLVMSGATAAGWLCLASFPHVPVCLWEGVQCDERQRVLSINLAGRGVSGAISPSLGHLPSLQSVYLFDNDLTGGIPDSLGLLSELRALDVRGNRLTGPVPPSLCALQHLHSLLLDGNAGLGAIPSCLQLTPDPGASSHPPPVHALLTHRVCIDAPPDDASGERLATPEPTSQPNDNSTRVFGAHEALDSPRVRANSYM